MNLLHIENEMIRLQTERRNATTAHESFIKRNTEQVHELLRQKEMLVGGIDLEKVAVAETLLEIRGLDNGRFNERCVMEAIKDIASGTNKMKKEYFGVKNYEGWTNQECDCRYGYGPTHGHITFSVGYKRNVLGIDLTDDQKESCLYYLNLLNNQVTRKAVTSKVAEMV